jgi:crotonobetaine/carnitine-CoA ligase
MATLYSRLRQIAEQHGDRVALISDEDGSRTYSELVSNASAIAYALRHELGMDFGERLGLWGLNRLEWVEVFVACSAAGVSCLPLNTDWTPNEAGPILGQAGVKTLVHDSHLSARAHALAPKVEGLEQLVSIGGAGLTLKQLVDIAPRDCASRLPEPPDNVGAPFFFTSGTAGSRSKAVVRKGNPQRMPPMEGLFGLTPEDRTIVVTPFFHGNGNSGFMYTLLYGGSVVFPRRFSASRFWPMVDRYRPTFMFTLMPIVNILMAQPPSAAEKHNSLEKILALGIAPYADAVEERFGVQAFDWYGGTEMGGCVSTPLNEPRRPGSTGKVLPGRSLFILDENMQTCAPGTVGQVAVLHEEVGFGGYAGDPEATNAVLSGKYFLTGDLAYIDEDGWFFFVDRLKDMVRRGGENLSSIEVEAVLREHPAIAEVAVLPRPDPVLGERVTALVVVAPGHELPDAKTLRSFASKQLAPFKIPDLIIPIESMPRTGTGKIRKAELRKVITDYLAQQEPDPVAANG